MNLPIKEQAKRDKKIIDVFLREKDNSVDNVSRILKISDKIVCLAISNYLKKKNFGFFEEPKEPKKQNSFKVKCLYSQNGITEGKIYTCIKENFGSYVLKKDDFGNMTSWEWQFFKQI